MSEYPVDKKETVQSELPIYRLNEEGVELTVGGEAPAKRGCFWKRFGRGGRCCRRGGVDGQERRERKRYLAKKILKGVVLLILFFSVSGFFIAKQKMHCIVKSHPIVCVPIEGGDASLTLPLDNRRTHIGLHESLTGGDIHITHSDAVEEGNVAFTFDLPKDVKYTDEEETPEYYICHVSGPRFVGVGIHSKDRDTEDVKATSTSVTLSSAEIGHSRPITLMAHKLKFGHKLFRKIFRKHIRKAIRQAVKEARLAKWEKIEHSDVE